MSPTSAERQRRHRERKRRGVIFYQVELRPEAITRLIQNVWLSEAEAQDRRSVAMTPSSTMGAVMPVCPGWVKSGSPAGASECPVLGVERKSISGG
jgi:hypothetical protein